jgi:hypothetical protein
MRRRAFVYGAKFELVVNLKAARSLGVAIAPAVLSRADWILE